MTVPFQQALPCGVPQKVTSKWCSHFTDQETGAGVACQASQWQSWYLNPAFQISKPVLLSSLRSDRQGHRDSRIPSALGLGVGVTCIDLALSTAHCAWHPSGKAHICTDTQAGKLPKHAHACSTRIHTQRKYTHTAASHAHTLRPEHTYIHIQIHTYL